ncbi:DUF4279 domain-containing protein [Kiloniella sp. b19]|uniref:DUF4279 domain-containing protein n=1 Tax=Kiloniella sp. GXU_MW_B19 TaxID=3141326 RepID=UPI0031D5F113
MTDDKLLESRLTPLDENYGTCAKTCAVLTIYPSCCATGQITRMLEIKPTFCFNLKDVAAHSIKHEGVDQMPAWCLSSEGKVDSRDTRHHLDWLLRKLEGAEERLQKIRELPDVKMLVNCIWHSKGTGGPTLWPEHMEILSKLDLECSFEIYWEGDHILADFFRNNGIK